jgi:hypothetical protein
MKKLRFQQHLLRYKCTCSCMCQRRAANQAVNLAMLRLLSRALSYSCQN